MYIVHRMLRVVRNLLAMSSIFVQFNTLPTKLDDLNLTDFVSVSMRFASDCPEIGLLSQQVNSFADRLSDRFLKPTANVSSREIGVFSLVGSVSPVD